MDVHTWEDSGIYHIWTVNQVNQNDWPKNTRNKCSIKEIQIATRVQLRDSLSLPMCLSTLTALFFFLINTLLASLISILVEILFCKAKGPGPLSLTTGLVARIWCFYCYDSAQSLAGSPSLASRHWRLRPHKSRLIASHSGSFFQELGQSVWRPPPDTGSKILDYTSSDFLSLWPYHISCWCFCVCWLNWEEPLWLVQDGKILPAPSGLTSLSGTEPFRTDYETL